LRKRKGKIHYTSEDYNWVKKILSSHTRGLSPKDLDRISSEQRKIHRDTWFERPPGRDKIYQILADYDGIDWDWSKTVGAGNKSVVKIKKINTSSIIGVAARDMLIFQKITSLTGLFDKRKEQLRLLEIIELHKIKESVINYPVMMLYEFYNTKEEKELQFTRALEISKKEIKKIKQIESEQLRINHRFKKTFEYLDEIKNSNLLESQIYGSGSKYKSFVSPRNSIRTIHRVNVKK
jgi:RNase H-fold protein (predicted Holliday junction resolvase)